MELKNGRGYVRIYIPEDEVERFVVDAIVGHLVTDGAMIVNVSDEAIEIMTNRPCGAIVSEAYQYLNELREYVMFRDYELRKPSAKMLRIECLPNHR